MSEKQYRSGNSVMQTSPWTFLAKAEDGVCVAIVLPEFQATTELRLEPFRDGGVSSVRLSVSAAGVREHRSLVASKHLSPRQVRKNVVYIST